MQERGGWDIRFCYSSWTFSDCVISGFFITPSQKVLFKLHTLDVRNAGYINFFSEKMRERPHLHIKCNFCSEYDTPVTSILRKGGNSV